MYLSYFGLAEPPFSSTPDRRFVYLSERHREGLAHLTWGLSEQGGFVQLTGEVGTGKTTLCRYLLDRLPSDVDVALILNPRVTPLELLATVCDELHVPYPAGSTSVKVFVDGLYAHLLGAHARGRRTVLIADEAQHLSVEVLEQMRLLTNLETPTAKLLQIILIGQPELSELLARTELRQVAQRIAARYHLRPLAERETRAYVLYRVQVAGQADPIFDDGALREIYRTSAGVPRVINMISDRALLAAYAVRKSRVDGALVREAAREVFGRSPAPTPRPRRWRWAPTAALALLALAGPSLLLASRLRPSPEPPRPAVAAKSAVVVPVARPPIPALATVLADPSLGRDAGAALATLFGRWGVESPSGVALTCDSVVKAGFQCLPRRGTWTLVRRLGLPSVLDLVGPAGDRRYAALVHLAGDTATLVFGDRTVTSRLDDIDRFWDGGFTVLWRPPRTGVTTLAPGAHGDAVAWLRARLGDIDHRTPDARDPRLYDDRLALQVVAFQREQSLPADGVVGPETLARLSAVLEPDTPRL